MGPAGTGAWTREGRTTPSTASMGTHTGCLQSGSELQVAKGVLSHTSAL